jgi:tuftelin-interacting protein 11
MGTHLEILYPVIRQKLGDALSNWHPADRSARLMLTPWSGVWSRGSMDAFLLRHIVPKLHTVFLQMNIAPEHEPSHQQFQWVLEWAELIPMPLFSGIYLQSFFPRWTQILSHWLNHAPMQELVLNWYVGYKKYIPHALQAVPAVKGMPYLLSSTSTYKFGMSDECAIICVLLKELTSFF